MRTTLALITGLTLLAPMAAQAQIPQGLLQQLLPGQQQGQPQNQQNVEQAVREAYERGYRAGRQDQERSDLNRGGNAPGSYQQQPNQGYPRNQYGR